MAGLLGKRCGISERRFHPRQVGPDPGCPGLSSLRAVSVRRSGRRADPGRTILRNCAASSCPGSSRADIVQLCPRVVLVAFVGPDPERGAEMSDGRDRTAQVQLRLDRLLAGDAAAGGELLGIVYERLNRLARKMLRDYPGVARWEETEDVLQNALVRLARALKATSPPTVPDFFRLAGALIRRELIDLARHHYGRRAGGGRRKVEGAIDDGSDPRAPSESTYDPERLALWTEFHRQVDRLEDCDREIFDMLWYQGLDKAEAAAVLGLTERTVNRRWLTARLKLSALLGDGLPI
jgi:RNA polymerase sigma factor (sigma-70 family)